MKEYEYTIIRRESRNPKRNRASRGISQSDLDALRRELEGDNRGIVSAIHDSDTALADLTLSSSDLSQRLTTAEGSIQSHSLSLGSQAEALASQAERLTAQGQQLTAQGESLSDYSQRLTTAEEGLRGTLSSETFKQWQAGEFKQALASKQPAGNYQPAGSYASLSQLVTSQQQAVTEAIKRAGEMDKQIKVGGRNLFRKKHFIGDLASYYKIPFDALQPREGDNTYTLSLDYKISPEDKASSPRISCRYSNAKPTSLVWDSDIKRDGEWHHKEYTIKLDIDPSEYPLHGWFTDYSYSNGRTIDMVAVRNIKLERGTVATDWTPAPEDVEESVSKVNTSVTALTSQLESHKTATAQSFADLANHPLTIDKDGYWQIWSVKDSKYLTTQYPSRGDKGDKGEDAGRYLGRAKRIHPDFNGNYLLETEDSWRTAKEGDYVYLVGDAPNRGGDKDTYYIVREHKGNTVWEVYDIKGHTPILSLDSQFRLLADNKPVSELSLKGDKGADGKDGERGADGKDGQDGHTPNIRWNGTHLLIDDLQAVDLRGQQGEAGHSPSPTEVLNNPTFSQQLTSKVTSEVTSQVAPVSQRLESIDDKAEEAYTIGSNAQRTANDMTDQVRLAMSGVSDLKTFQSTATSQLSDLSNRSLTLDQKRDLGYLTFTLKSMTSGSNGTLEGLALQRYIALSGDNQTVSAYLASNVLPAVLKAGITNFGTPQEREQVEITHQGTGHFGNLYFTGNQIDFKTGRYDAPYLSIGAEESDFVESFINNARVIDTPVSISTLTLTSSLERSVSVANGGTRLTIVLDKISVDVYGSSSLRLTLDGETLAEWRGDAKYIDTSGHTTDGGSSFRIERTPYEASNLSYERVVKAGNHTVRLEIVAPRNGNATVTGFRVRRRYDTGAQQSVLTKSGLRLFASPDRYLDVDYRKSVLYSAPNRLGQWISNPYLVRIVGGAKVDKLTADELDAPGVPLCGASFNVYGTQIKAFGERAKRQGMNSAQAVYYDSGRFFRVYHSIGHTNYIPTVQVIDSTDNDINWNLTARIYAVNANDFAVRIITNGNNPIRHAFSFVAFKTM